MSLKKGQTVGEVALTRPASIIKLDGSIFRGQETIKKHYCIPCYEELPR